MAIDNNSRNMIRAGKNGFPAQGTDKAEAEAGYCPPYLSGKRRSRRLRKKLRIGEFQEFGFEFEVKLKNPHSFEEEAALIDSFISEVIEPRSLAFGGSLRGGFIAHGRRGSATEEDRTSARKWLSARPEVDSVAVGPLIDAWDW